MQFKFSVDAILKVNVQFKTVVKIQQYSLIFKW